MVAVFNRRFTNRFTQRWGGGWQGGRRPFRQDPNRSHIRPWWSSRILLPMVAAALSNFGRLDTLVLNAGVTRDCAEIEAETIQHVRERIGPVAAFKLCIVVDRLPKTRSGKILRGTMRSIADGEPWKMPATIDDPVIIEEVSLALKKLGLPAS